MRQKKKKKSVLGESNDRGHDRVGMDSPGAPAGRGREGCSDSNSDSGAPGNTGRPQNAAGSDAGERRGAPEAAESSSPGARPSSPDSGMDGWSRISNPSFFQHSFLLLLCPAAVDGIAEGRSSKESLRSSAAESRAQSEDSISEDFGVSRASPGSPPSSSAPLQYFPPPSHDAMQTRKTWRRDGWLLCWILPCS